MKRRTNVAPLAGLKALQYVELSNNQIASLPSLEALNKGSEKLSAEEQSRLWSGLGAAYLSIGEQGKAEMGQRREPRAEHVDTANGHPVGQRAEVTPPTSRADE